MQLIYQLFCIYIIYLEFSNGQFIVEPGPLVKQTNGGVWPKPQVHISDGNTILINITHFKFQSKNITCSFLENTFERYQNIIKRQNIRRLKLRRKLDNYKNVLQLAYSGRNEFAQTVLEVLTIELKEPCDRPKYPSIDMDEKYQLEVHAPSGLTNLIANTIWGVLRGLESFSQLIYVTDEGLVQLNSTLIIDSPRFPHRGLLLDTSRHFMPKEIIYKMLDAMSYNKLNVFHWHIVDDQSFPYESKSFPQLSKKAAYHSSMIYSQNDIKNIIDYAAERGIRVIAEMDTPGHTRSWGVSNITLLTACYDKRTGLPDGTYGPMNPIEKSTYNFIQTLFNEAIQVFPDEYFHLGGDEVEFTCWESNPDIRQFMEKYNLTDYTRLQDIFLTNLLQIINDKMNYIVWDEAFRYGPSLPKSVIVQVWTSNKVLNDVTNAGYKSLLNSCWYLDHLSWGGDWEKFYHCDPYNLVITQQQRDLILGGEASMWSESVDSTNVLQRVWPRASAAAEKLWSDPIYDMDDVKRRLEEHTCRMNFRNIPAQPPNGPGVCL